MALDREETWALLAGVAEHRLGAAVARLFLQGWRVSEVLGLAWEDVDHGRALAHAHGRRDAEEAAHAGWRPVVTTLFVDGDEALEDIARFVGHAKPTTTAGYVKRLGQRPDAVAERAAAVLDGHAEREGSAWKRS